MPVSTTPMTRGPNASAADLNRGSAAGRTPHTGGLVSSATTAAPFPAPDPHVESPRGKIDPVVDDELVGRGLADAEAAGAVQPMRQALCEPARHVLHDEYGRPNGGWHRREHLRQGARTARGGCDTITQSALPERAVQAGSGVSGVRAAADPAEIHDRRRTKGAQQLLADGREIQTRRA